jgi:hypothetical protein
VFDILDDTIKDNDIGDSLELDKIKHKIKDIWSKIVAAQYKDQYPEGEDLDTYLEENTLYFQGEERPDSELETLLSTLDELFNDKEDLDPIDSSGSSPSYAGKSLKSVSEGRSSNPGTYKYTHSTTTTPSDSPTTVSSTSYTIPKSGSLKRNKSSDRSTAISRSLMELLEEERRKLLKIVTRRNKEFGVIL